MGRAAVVAAFIGVTVTTVVATLCVVLIPLSSDPDTTITTEKQYTYSVANNGTITWSTKTENAEKLKIVSSILKETQGELNKDFETPCGYVSATVKEMESLTENGSECWRVEMVRKQTTDCSSNDRFRVSDCLSMTANGHQVYWYGGAEMVTQRWPVNGVNLEKPTVFLSSDLPLRHGNVLESYYLSSLGAAVYIYPDTPLYVSIESDHQICLEAAYDIEDPNRVGPSYLKPSDSDEILKLSYAVCVGDTIVKAHQRMTNPKNGLIKRPPGLPDLKMMQDPIWSTWARFKDAINQTIVEQYAVEILSNNFTNSQLEIDDGYEREYGDFTFDPEKFPNAKEMVDRLHSLGFRVTTWVTPFVNLNSSNYGTGKSGKYFVPSEDGSPSVIRWWNDRGSPIDFTNDEASNWYKNILESVKSTYGVDSFKFDAGETTYLPPWGLSYAAKPWSNPGDYTTAYSKVAFDIGGSIAEMRSSWKTQDIPFYMRLMDKGSTWDYTRGFQTVIPTALTFSVIGYPFVLPDMIGGNAYVLGRNNTGVPDRELYIRWIELGAFLPCMQFSIAPWQYDQEVTDIARKYVELHRTVIYDELIRAANRYVAGEMSLLVSPIWIHAEPGDEDAFRINDEFIVGDKYLVAPIVEQGSTSRDIYLPGDVSVRWRDRMRDECGEEDSEDCVMPGGSWVLSYHVPLNEISWWEKL